MPKKSPKSFIISQLANGITFSRLFGIAIIFFFTPYQEAHRLWIVALLFALLSLSDILDGWVARRLNSVTKLGKILDPLADKLLILVFLPLLEMGMIGSFPVFILISREFCVMAIRIFYASHLKHIVSASLLGKIKTALTFPLCLILILRVPVSPLDATHWLHPLEHLRFLINATPQFIIDLWILSAIFFSLLSFLVYIWPIIIKNNTQAIQSLTKKTKLLIPNLCSLGNLSCGLLALVMASNQNIKTAVFLVLLGLFFDVCDGFLARLLHSETQFGKYLDTLSDSITFGLAPSFIAYKLLSPSIGFTLSIIMGLIFLLAILYRLKRFTQKTSRKDYFEGIPAPIAAAFICLLTQVNTSSVGFAIPILSFLCVSKYPFFHISYLLKEVMLFRFLFLASIPLLLISYLHLLNCLTISLYNYEGLLLILSLYIISPLFLKRRI